MQILADQEVLNANRMFRKKFYGQGMTEYIIIVALIAVAAIAVYRIFGKKVRNQTAGIAQEVAGQDGSTAIAAAGTAASAASTAAGQDTTLSTYGNQKGKGTGAYEDPVDGITKTIPWTNRDTYGKPTIVGTVDMSKYSRWLERNYALVMH